MPHGDFSDAASFTCLTTGITTIVAPQLWFASIGPLKPFFDLPALTAVEEGAEPVAPPPPAAALAAVQFAGGMLLMMAPILFVVRWNILNGKAGALGFFMAAANSVSIALAMDDYKFVLRGWYLLAGFFALTACHLAFNANPMLTSAMLLEKEKVKAAKEQAKAK